MIDKLDDKIMEAARTFEFPLFGYEQLCRKLWPEKRSNQWTRTREYRRVIYWCDKLHEKGLMISTSGSHGDRVIILTERVQNIDKR